MSGQNKNNAWFFVKLAAVPILMFGFAFAMVPLYGILCDITGLNGKTGRISQAQVSGEIDETRQVAVNFLARSATGFPVDFRPEVTQLMVTPGKKYHLNYLARNTSEQTIIGQAIPSVAPGLAATSFNKIACFCFDKQTFLPKQSVKMPVVFVVSPKLNQSIEEITLSYQFFKINNKG